MSRLLASAPLGAERRRRSRFACQLPVADGDVGTTCDLSRTGLGAIFVRRYWPDEALMVQIASLDRRTLVVREATVAHLTGKVTGVEFREPLTLDELEALL